MPKHHAWIIACDLLTAGARKVALIFPHLYGFSAHSFDLFTPTLSSYNQVPAHCILGDGPITSDCHCMHLVAPNTLTLGYTRLPVLGDYNLLARVQAMVLPAIATGPKPETVNAHCVQSRSDHDRPATEAGPTTYPLDLTGSDARAPRDRRGPAYISQRT